ncbi:MAG: type II toxin-antitoxin system MqsA family antitoxin [Anaerolineae bacterium]
MNEKAIEKKCPVCGSTTYEVRLLEYIYRRDGRYLIVRDVPAEVCTICQTRFYRAEVLQEIERLFQAIYTEKRQPAGSITVPVESYQAA